MGMIINNQEFIDSLSHGLTEFNKRTKQRNIAIGTAGTFGAIILGYLVKKMIKNKNENKLVHASNDIMPG